MVENESCSNNHRKKQVRFNASSKMASSPSDHQLPRPLTDIQNLEKRSYARGETFGPGFSQSATKSVTPFSNKSAYLPPSSLNSEPVQAKFSLPKPSVDLELSILDSSEVAKGTTLGRSKIYENDNPYCFSPSKMPLQSVYKPTQSEKLFSFSPGMVTSAAQSKKEFPTEKSDTNPGLGFFTLPNSAGLYQDKKTPTMLRDDVANAKSKLMNHKNFSDTHLQFCNAQENVNLKQKQPAMPIFDTQMLFGTNKFGSEGQINASQTGSREQIRLENVNFGSQPQFRVDNDRVPCNENLAYRMPNNQTCKQNMPMYNRFNCCPNSYNHNVGPVCCSQEPRGYAQNVCQHYEENIYKKPETVGDGLEMKRKAIEARQNKFIEKENAVTPEYDNEHERDVVTRSKSDQPTVSDLYEIIKLQNKQLQMLQQRVDMLLTVKESNLDARKSQDVERTKISTKGVIEPATAAGDDAVNMNCIEHISIGVMTSFELVMSSNYVNKRSVTFNPQANVNLERRKDECVQTTQNISGDAGNYDVVPSLQVSPADDGGVNFLDGITPYNKPCSSEGLVLVAKTPRKTMTDNIGGRVQTDPVIPKTNRKPLPSAQINVNSPIAEYNDECFDEAGEECSQPNIGWTLYNNVMNRVNNMLHSPTNGDRTPVLPRGHIAVPQNQHVTTAERVTVDPSPVLAPANLYRHDRPSSELSLHMRHLATKYNIASPGSAPARQENIQPQFQVFGGDARNEMSLATMQYMQKYQLLSVTNDQLQQQMPYDRGAIPYDRRSPQHLKPAYKNPSRILDITALKQQSKLL